VNHQVHYDADVGRAGRKRRNANALDETRLGGDFLEKGEHGVETFDVADLEDAIIFLRELHQLGRLLGGLGHRLFDEDVFAVREQLSGEIEMRGRRRDDVQRVGMGGGFGDGGEDAQIVLRGDLRAVSAWVSKMPANSNCFAAASSA
jgi:hypothetical protein